MNVIKRLQATHTRKLDRPVVTVMLSRRAHLRTSVIKVAIRSAR